MFVSAGCAVPVRICPLAGRSGFAGQFADKRSLVHTQRGLPTGTAPFAGARKPRRPGPFGGLSGLKAGAVPPEGRLECRQFLPLW